MSYTPKPYGNVKNFFSNKVKSIYLNNSKNPWLSLSITNDGKTHLTFTVNNITITVNASEQFTDNFEDFNKVEINQNINHRIILRG